MTNSSREKTYALNWIVFIVKPAPCFKFLTATTVSNNIVCIATRAGCEVRKENSQLAFQTLDLINIIWIFTVDVAASSESDLWEWSEQL